MGREETELVLFLSLAQSYYRSLSQLSFDVTWISILFFFLILIYIISCLITMKVCFLKMDSSDTDLHLCFNWNAFGQKFVVIWLLAHKHMTLNIWLGAGISSFRGTVTLWCVTRHNDLMV